MGQVGLGAMFMKTQVANASTNYTTFTKGTKQANEHTFSKELDKAKTVHSREQDKSHITKMKDDRPSEVTQKAKKEVKKTESVNEDKIDEELKDELETGKDENEVDENILLLLSERLNVTTDELKELLNQMGYVASDLMEQENFGKFISEVYSQIKGEDLLMIEAGAKSMSTLFEQLQAMNDETKTQSISVTLQSRIDSEISINNLFDKTEQIIHNIQNASQTEEQINNLTMENISIQNATQNMEQNNKFQDVEEPLNLLNGISINDADKVDIGMVVPIHNFSSSTYTQLWKPEGSTSMQVPQFIETDIIDQIDFKTLGITKEIHLQLSPKELGELSIKLIEENSTIVAHIKVDNEKAKMFLLSQMNDLKTALEERGLTVVDVKVDINQDTRQSQMEQEKQKSSKRIQEIISKHLDEFEQEEQEVSEKISDSEVDYMV